MISPIIQDYYQIEEEFPYFSILPTATQYARNAIFSGLMPLEMEKYHPDLWVNENDKGGKNINEKSFLKSQLKRNELSLNLIIRRSQI